MSDGIQEHRDGAPQPADTLSARVAALSLLESIFVRGRPLDQLLDDRHTFGSMAERDRAFARMLVATTLRRAGQADDLLRRAQSRPGAPIPSVLQNILRMGVTQLIFMNVPDHAAVDTSVRLTESAGLARQKGFVNAVLRRIAGAEGKNWLDQQDAARLNIPAWMLKEWAADYDAGTAAQMAVASLSEAPLDITLKNPGLAPHWAEQLEASILPTGTLRRPSGGAVQSLPGYADGMWWVQDAAAAIPARLFGDLTGKLVVDLCAAPGGKTGQMAAAGAHVMAVDRSAQRLKRLEENMKRLLLGDRVTTEVADGGEWRPARVVDAVLLDAPCTATGTIRRHPDILQLKSLDDMRRMMEVQSKLLANAVRMLAPGGILIYCTCSLQKAEGERQIARLLEKNPQMRRKPILPQDVGGAEHVISPEGDLRVLPFHLAAHGGMDGFYAARLVRE